MTGTISIFTVNVKTVQMKDSFKDINPGGLEELYETYNRKKYIHPDPLEFVYNYEDKRDREVAGFIGASLAYGRVNQILKAVKTVLEKMGESPYYFLLETDIETIENKFKDFIYRFTDGETLTEMLAGLKSILEKYGSVEPALKEKIERTDSNILNPLNDFIAEICETVNIKKNYLLPLPERGSACKRWNLFLRWMIRDDRVDPGCWDDISPSLLVVPLDTHMYRISKALNFTSRNQPDRESALEITDSFRELVPRDPVRYDFTLTRLGLNESRDCDYKEELKKRNVLDIA